MEKDLFEKENENSPFLSFLKEIEEKPPLSNEQMHQYEHSTTFSSAFLVELVHRIKNTLGSIKTFTLLSVDKFDDVEFRKYSLNSVAEDIKKIDSVLNSLLNYINVNTPLIKTNTVPLIL
jgi:two-component sensor histidine kinase